jgi:hypothetical protein
MPADGNPASRITHYQALGINCLITRVGGQFFASFNDGFTEEFTPPDGKPRPDPDLATKTKHQKVPWTYQQIPDRGFFYIKTSTYTGQMRLAAGSYFGRGVQPPFVSDIRVGSGSHGIFQALVVIEGKTVIKHWVIEISRDGVFAAPITAGSWNVSRYLQSPNSNLHLAWALANKPDSGVVELLSASAIAPVYETAGYYLISHQNWAFSYSGAEAQIVGWRAVSTPCLYIKSALWKLTFQLIGSSWPNVQPSASLQMIEKDKVIGLFNDYALYAPFDHGNVVEGPRPYDGIKFYYSSLDSGDHPSIHFRSQDAPVCVYYDGEEAVIVRWKSDREDIDEIPDSDPHIGHYAIVTAGWYCTGKFNHVRTHNSLTAGTNREGISALGASALLLMTEREAVVSIDRITEQPVAPGVIAGPWVANGKAVLCMAGGHLVKEDLTFHMEGSFPQADNTNLGDFVNYDFFAETTSNIEAVHGSLYYDDLTLKPPNQKTNAIYRLGGAVISVGGFNRPAGSRTIAFVGKA